MANLPGDCAVALLHEHLALHHPMAKRFTAVQAVAILDSACSLDPASVDDYLTAHSMSSVSLRDLGTMARSVAQAAEGQSLAIVDEAKICKQYKQTGTCTFGSRCLYYHSYGGPVASATRRMMGSMASSSNNHVAPVSVPRMKHKELVAPQRPPHETRNPTALSTASTPQQTRHPQQLQQHFVIPHVAPPCLTFVVPALLDINGNFIRYLSHTEAANHNHVTLPPRGLH